MKKTGARGLRSILENILLKTMFELPDMENVIKVTVDRASVKGSSEPIVTYGKTINIRSLKQNCTLKSAYL